MTRAATALEIRAAAPADAGAIAGIDNQGVARARLDDEWKDLLIVERLLGEAAKG